MNIVRKLKYLVPSHRRAIERDMREELESLAAIAHAQEARRELGNLTRAAEEARAVWSWTWLEQLREDVRYAARTMRHSLGFTATALLSLALAIGANTAIFSLMNAILLRTLPVSHPESLVVLSTLSQDGRIDNFGYQDYLTVSNGNRAFSGVLGASSQARIDVGMGAETEVALRKVVSDNYFSVLGVQPLIGRVFSNKDEGIQVAVISNRFWERSFAGSPSAIGKQIDLDGLPFTIVGVASPEFLGETVGEAPDIWATLSSMPTSRRDLPGFTWLNLMGRLKPGVHVQQARADLSLLLPQLPDSVSRGGFIDRISVETGERGGSGLRDSFSDPLHIVMALVAMVLLIACANLASLQLARGATRQREIATRLALGASRGRIVRQLMTESLLLALLGGVLGLLFAVWSERLLLSLVAGVGRPIAVDLRPDMHVLGFTGVISVATGVLFGLAPALQTLSKRAGAGLKLNLRIVARRGRRWRLKDGLIAIQIALSLLLLVVGGLFIRTIQNLKTQDLGFHTNNVLSVQVSSQREYQPNWASVIVSLLRRTEAIPGVHVASVSFNEILANDGSGVSGLKFDGYPPTRETQRVGADWVGPNYFETSGIPLLEGREFSQADNSTAQKVAIINQAMARQYFGNRPASGHRFELNKERYEIIGVAKNAKYLDLRESTAPFVYFAALQNNSGIHSLEVRTTGSPVAFAGAVRVAVRKVDPLLRIGEVTTLEKRVHQQLAREFLVADIAGFFSGLTFLLVSIGIYGTLAYAVARRTNEIGIRMALGARATTVLSVILRDVLWVLVLGLAAGVAAALAAGRLVASMLFGLRPTDLPTIALAVLVLSAGTLAAGYIPARRALRVDPATALRFE
ncbi:MAG: ABC transporter permease [Bryobacteraceae bacterium]